MNPEPDTRNPVTFIAPLASWHVLDMGPTRRMQQRTPEDWPPQFMCHPFLTEVVSVPAQHVRSSCTGRLRRQPRLPLKTFMCATGELEIWSNPRGLAYGLRLVRHNGTRVWLAKHASRFSCQELATQFLFGSRAAFADQVAYIAEGGGVSLAPEVIRSLCGEPREVEYTF